MRQTLSMMIFAGAVTIITLSSCTKEQPISDSNYVSPSSYSPPISQAGDLYLVANNWVNYGNQIYVNTFKGVLPSGNASRTVLVYAIIEGKEVQISQTHTTYKGNQLWANDSGVDVMINYQCNTALPFSFLDIRVQVKY